MPYNIDEEFDIVGCDELMWVSIGNNELSLFDDNNNEIVISPSGNDLVANVYYTNGSKHQIVTKPLPPEVCIKICDEYAHKNLQIKYAKRSASWQQKKELPTPRQWMLLRELGHKRKVDSKYEAGLIIRTLKAKKNRERRNTNQEAITSKQHYFLMSHGVNPNGITKSQAMHIISTIKKEQPVINGYK